MQLFGIVPLPRQRPNKRTCIGNKRRGGHQRLGRRLFARRRECQLKMGRQNGRVIETGRSECSVKVPPCGVGGIGRLGSGKKTVKDDRPGGNLLVDAAAVLPFRGVPGPKKGLLVLHERLTIRSGEGNEEAARADSARQRSLVSPTKAGPAVVTKRGGHRAAVSPSKQSKETCRAMSTRRLRLSPPSFSSQRLYSRTSFPRRRIFHVD